MSGAVVDEGWRFGPRIEGDATRFALWAPSVPQVTLEIVDPQGQVLARHPLQRDADGFHQARVAGAGAGTLYRFRVRDDLAVPDPASRSNPQGVHGPSEVIAAAAEHPEPGWSGRPWHEAVVYELHVGTFTPEGTLAAAAARLPALQAAGITAVELLPLAAFPGERGWGYDGVLPFAVHPAYGRPEDLRAFADAAHALGLMVLLDVVYNHFGPDGNYMAAYCPELVNPEHHTPWGSAINFDGEHNAPVRRFFIENALYWVGTCGLDGLRLDAVHALVDTSQRHIVQDIGAALLAGPGRHRHVHLVLENERNSVRMLTPPADAPAEAGLAQWDDDWHHAAHVVATGETDGYYSDYAEQPVQQLAKALAEGFIFQGQPSPFAHGERRGEPSTGLRPTAFIVFLQNHDQIGNRAMGERLDALAPAARVEALLTLLLLSPQVPMLFMGEEFAATTPFLYFCDHAGDLAHAVTEGRRNEFARFAAFSHPEARERIPDPNAAATFDASTLRWAELQGDAGQRRLRLVTTLLALRREHLWPLMPQLRGAGQAEVQGDALHVHWQADDGSRWHLRAHLGDGPARLPVGPDEQALHLQAARLEEGACHFDGAGAVVTLEPALRAAGQ